MPNSQLDAAKDWVLKNPNNPNVSNVQAKIWAMENPDHPAANSVLQKVQQNAQNSASQNSFQISNAQDEKTQASTGGSALDNFLSKGKAMAQAAGNEAKDIGAGLGQGLSLGYYQDGPNQGSGYGKIVGELAGGAATGLAVSSALGPLGAAAGEMLPSAAQFLNKAPFLGRLLNNSATGAALGGLAPTEGDVATRMQNAISGAASGLKTGALGELAGAIPGAVSAGARMVSTGPKQAGEYMTNLAKMLEERGANSSHLGDLSSTDAKTADAARSMLNQQRVQFPEVDQAVKDAGTIMAGAKNLKTAAPYAMGALAHQAFMGNPNGAAAAAAVPAGILAGRSAQVGLRSLMRDSNGINDPNTLAAILGALGSQNSSSQDQNSQ